MYTLPPGDVPQGDVLKLVDDIAALQPSLFIGVPRVFDRIYTRIMSQVSIVLLPS